MTSYQRALDVITGEPSKAGVVRVEDGAFIPADPANLDWRAYLDWLSAGNEPAPSVAGPTDLQGRPFINR